MGAAEPARLSERALRLGSSRCASRAVRTARRGNDLLRAMLRATSCPLASHHERTRWTTNAARVSSATPRDQPRGAPAALLRPRLSLVACFSFVVCVCDPHTRSARSKRRPLLPTARSSVVRSSRALRCRQHGQARSSVRLVHRSVLFVVFLVIPVQPSAGPASLRKAGCA